MVVYGLTWLGAGEPFEGFAGIFLEINRGFAWLGANEWKVAWTQPDLSQYEESCPPRGRINSSEGKIYELTKIQTTALVEPS
jgi:hypothetical protein